MPERIGWSNMVNILEGEVVIPTDGQDNYEGPGTVRIHEFPGAIQVQTDDDRKLEIQGIETIEEFMLIVQKD